ncbi:monoamine oxidase [Neobacillus niacini]|nr:FAD-dependent oxidoreductase [Neobacillus niacini]MDR7077255.1 monoamine oxidase [Neobacillus niacini]
MARTALASILQRSFALACAEMEEQINPRIERIIECNSSQKGLVTSGIEKKQFFNDKWDGKSVLRIAIVGAGLAGLTCAYRLKQEGVIAAIYEATERVGGRCWTRRGYFKNGQVIERGGEFIDTCHREIQELAKELGLQFDHLIKSEIMGTKPFYFFKGAPYSFDEVKNDFKQIYPKLQSDLIEAGEMTSYHSYTQRGFELDHMSITDYINEIVSGGVHSRFGKLLEVAYTIENGAAAHKQSALNLLYLLGFAQKDQFQIYGDSDECFHIRGGNDQLPALLAKNLDGQIQYNARLVRITQNGPKSEVTLVFQKNGKEWEVTADKVILAIPFSILRMIDYEDASFRQLKKAAIEELEMGVNTKLHVQFVKRFWNELGNNGETFTDAGSQQTFESTRAQQGTPGILCNFTGDETAAKQIASTNEELNEIVKKFLDKLNLVMPESHQYWNGLATVDHWLSNQWTQGSYSYWKVGQFTKFAGIAGEREGNIFFAGEHTSIKYPGYLNGAVESGERAAQEIINAIHNKK